ncbi:MAG: non-canonical purine NTP pyrophosphatase [Solirubrobacteraceae bacterium]
MRLLLATHNPHKRRELARLLPGHEIEMLPDGFELPPEEGETFEQNAFGKARAAARLAKRLRALAIAEDSGVEAAALGGAPGVRSARFAGVAASDGENLAKLVAQAPEGSALRYVCAIALLDPDSGAEQTFFGYCTGTLASATRGQRGFGYDPAFLPDEQPRGAAGAASRLTMAELSDAEKDAISHRGRAVRALLDALAQR